MGAIVSVSLHYTLVSLDLAIRHIKQYELTNRVMRAALAYFSRPLLFWKCGIEATKRSWKFGNCARLPRTAPIRIPGSKVAFFHPVSNLLPESSPCEDNLRSEEKDSSEDELMFYLEL